MADRGNNLQRGSEAALILGGLVLILAGLTSFLPGLRGLGIHPRTLDGLAGILFAPLLHSSKAHLMANLAPLMVLAFALFANPGYHPARTLILIWMAAGLGTWLIGRGGSVHIGASSVIYGLAAYLITAGVRMRSWVAAFVAAGVCFLYGGLVYGVLPQAGPISWEGHLCGAIAGVWAAVEIHD